MSDLKAKMCQNRFRIWGSAPDPARGAYRVLSDSLARFKGPTSKGKGEEGREEKGRKGAPALRWYGAPEWLIRPRFCAEMHALLSQTVV